MTELPVAVVKREFRRLLDAAEHGERTVILRHGRPVAALEPLRSDQPSLPVARRPGGLLSLLGTFESWPTMQEDMAQVIALRASDAERPVPDFS